MREKREQIPYLYALRAIAILFVIMIHCYTPYFLNTNLFGTKTWYGMLMLNAFCRAGVPLFLMISGALLLGKQKTLDIGSFYKKRLTRIVVPLVAWSIIYFVIEAVRIETVVANHHMDFVTLFKSFVARLFSAHSGGVSYHFWYLYTLIGLYLAAPFIKRVTDACAQKQLWAFLGVMTFFTAVMPVIHLTTPIYVYFFDPIFNGYMGYFLFGYILSKTDVSGKFVPLVAVASVSAGFCISFFGNHLNSSAELINPVFNGGYYANHYLIAGGIFILAKRFFTLGKGVLFGAAKILSDCSFVMYFVHVMIIGVFTNFLPPELSPALCIIVMFFATSVASTLFSSLLIKIKFLSGILF